MPNCNPAKSKTCGKGCLTLTKTCRTNPDGTKIRKAPRPPGAPRPPPKCTEGVTRPCGKVCRALEKPCRIDGTPGVPREPGPQVTNKKAFDLFVRTQRKANSIRDTATGPPAAKIRYNKLAREFLQKAYAPQPCRRQQPLPDPVASWASGPGDGTTGAI
jgi:hypothetical protein